MKSYTRSSEIEHSIIIPSAGRVIAARETIRSLLKYPLKECGSEIVLVDNNTAQDLVDDLRAFCLTLEGRLRYIHEPSPGLSAARHRGAAEAWGSILTFIDDDVEVSDGWLNAIQNGFANRDVAMVGGPSIPKFTSSIPAWFWDYVEPTIYGGWSCSWLSLLDLGKDVQDIDPNYIWGLNFSIRKQVLVDCGGFHPDLLPVQLQRWQGDGETGLTMKVKAAGYRADYLQGAMLWHLCGADRLNVEYFRRRAYFQGVCDSFTELRHRRSSSSENPNMRTGIRRAMGLIGKIARRIRRKTSTWAADSASVRQLTAQAWRDGWSFHQREVTADPQLRDWVQQTNFLDADVRALLAKNMAGDVK